MIRIFGLLFFIILICLIYLYYQNKISRNIPIIFMFFIILIIPFTYLENNKNNIESFSSYDQIMNSSLDIFYTNQNKTKKELNVLKKVPLLNNPLQAQIIKKDLNEIMLYLYTLPNMHNLLYVIYNNNWHNIYHYYGSENVFTYLLEDDFNKSSFKGINISRIKKFNNLDDLNILIENAPAPSFIVIAANNISPILESSTEIKNNFINKYKFSDWINNQYNTGSLVVILSKTFDKLYINLNEKNKNTFEGIDFYQIIKIESEQIITNGGDIFKNVKTNSELKNISNDSLVNSKINIISPASLNPNYALSITVENNESFVYLSSRKINDEIALYSKSPKDNIGPISSTYLDTQRPQFWSFEPVTQHIFNPLIVFIRTYSKPYFYLDAEFENGVIVLKAKRIKAALRQHWEIIRNPDDITKYRIRHLKSSMYLAYSDFDGYLYKSDGSVFLTKSNKYIWNIKQIDQSNIDKNLIEGFESSKINSYQAMEVPTDFNTVKDPIWKISGNIKGKNIVIEGSGRTLWEPSFVPIWNGKWIYYGTVESYKATLNINTVKFLIINVDQNGKGNVKDEYLNFTMNVISAGANILTGIIPSGKYMGFRAILKLIPTDLSYSDPSKSFPIKMRYIIEKDAKKINLSSGNIYNMKSYSTKFIGDRLILSNFLEASGIQTDPNLAFSSKNLQEINAYIKEQANISNSIMNVNRFLTKKIISSNLLYKATVHGWNPSIFHQLCDNKGETITIATLKDGRYIGAYSPVSWGKVNGEYINNSEAFLFDSEKKYTTSESVWGPNNYAIYQVSNYGPTFGGGHDFLSLSPWATQYIINNCFTFINNGKGPLGVNMRTYNAYELSDLEVHRITTINKLKDLESNRITRSNNQQNEWKIFPKYTTPVRIDKNSGHIQCLSYNGKDCEWDYVSKYGYNLNYIDKNRENPLTCGQYHLNKWGVDGYSDPNHWCSNVKNFFNPKVIVYEHANYQGRKLELDPGKYDYNFISRNGFNDIISSMKIPNGWKVEAYEHAGYQGRKWVFNSDTNWVGNDANDIFSCLVVTSN
jgi:hypothetical protein